MQQINESKSSLFFNTDAYQLVFRAIEEELQIPSTREPEKYLVITTVWGRQKKKALCYLKTRIRDKIRGWMVKTLNQAEKEVLIKSVIIVIPAYVMRIFKLLKT